MFQEQFEFLTTLSLVNISILPGNGMVIISILRQSPYLEHLSMTQALTTRYDTFFNELSLQI